MVSKRRRITMETTTTTQTATTTAATATIKRAPTATELAFNYLMFGLSTVATLAFAYYLITNPSVLNDAWVWIRQLPLVVQLLAWLLFLPWMFALWVWTQPWAVAIRLVLVVGTLLFTEYLMFPWKP
jgi:hypothetical protein